MKKLLLFIFHFVLPIFLLAQNGSSINGIVTDKKTGEPLPGVNVFISGTFNGTTTNIDGQFELNNVTNGGQTLVISMIGYKRFYQPIEKSSNLFDKPVEFQLEEKIYELNNINVVVDEGDWKFYYKKFLEKFIGTRKYGDQCEILNPYAINFYYVDSTDVLTADCDSMLTLINRALGYKINFILTNFVFVLAPNVTSGRYVINPVYEELIPKDENEYELWLKNRDEAYYTSPRYFLKSLVKGNVSRNDFNVYKREYIINDYGEKEYLSNSFVDVEAGDLDVEYDPVEEYYIFDAMFDLAVESIDNGERIKSGMDFANTEVYIFPDGSLVFPEDIVWTKHWAKYRVSDLLPFGFEPTEER